MVKAVQGCTNEGLFLVKPEQTNHQGSTMCTNGSLLSDEGIYIRTSSLLLRLTENTIRTARNQFGYVDNMSRNPSKGIGKQKSRIGVKESYFVAA